MTIVLISRRRQWRAWQFARRHRNHDILGELFSGDSNNTNSDWPWWGWLLLLISTLLLICLAPELIIPLGIIGWIIIFFGK